MRLIDADKLIILAENTFARPNGFIRLIEETETAYNVDAVVAELEKAKEKVATEDYCRTKHYVENDCEHKDCFKCCSEYLIDIVKRSGVE